MATATVSGTISFAVANTAPVAAISLGAPSVNPTSTTAYQVTFTEQATCSYYIAGLATQAINFATIASGDLVYVGVDQAATLTINGATPALSLAQNGFVLLAKSAITSLSLTAGAAAVNVQVMILGA